MSAEHCGRGYCYKLGLSLFFFRVGTCFIEREVVVGGGFRVSQMPCLEWLVWPLAWLLEFVGLGTWLP